MPDVGAILFHPGGIRLKWKIKQNEYVSWSKVYSRLTIFYKSFLAW
jgi:hypothetical protein